MEIRPAIDTLRDVRGGALIEECDETLHQLIQDCLDTHKTGTLTLTLKLTPPKQGAEYMHVNGTVKATKPVVPADTMFFMDTHGNLTRRDPKQPELSGLEGDVKVAESDQQPAKEA